MKICIQNGTLISMSKNREIQEENIDILIENEKISKIAKKIEITSDTTIIDATGKIIMPGLINTHAHVPMSIFRETLDGYDLQDWLTKKIWPMEDKLTEKDIYYASYLSFIEMIKTGTTTINDMYFKTEQIIQAMKETGIRLQTTRTLIGDLDKEGIEKIEELENLIEKYKNEDNKLSFNIGIHGLYTTTERYVEKCVQIANKYNLPIHIHFCENQKEVNDIIDIYNREPTKILSEKMENNKLILAHCVKLSDQDIEQLSKMNVSISHCPISNLKLGCGIAKIDEMQNRNINISLGTDGQGSGSSLDLFEVMKYTALLQKGITEDPKKMSAYEILKMATINGAKTLGLEDKIGSIEEGKIADIIILNLDTIVAKPMNNLISEIVYNAKGNNVETTIVNGQVLMENRKLSKDNEDEITKICEKIIKKIQ